MIINTYINIFIELIEKKLGYKIKLISVNNQSIEKKYTACQFQINEYNCLFRISKVTPKKIGQFVTIWRRDLNNITTPYSNNDTIEFLIILCSEKNKLGCFIFNKKILIEKNIFSTSEKEGKRGIRIYPAWHTSLNAIAEKTQKWQIKYFIDLQSHEEIIVQKIKNLLTTDILLD